MTTVIQQRAGTPVQVALQRLQAVLAQRAQDHAVALSPEATLAELQSLINETGIAPQGFPRPFMDVYYDARRRVDSGVGSRQHCDFLLVGLQRTISDSLKLLS